MRLAPADTAASTAKLSATLNMKMIDFLLIFMRDPLFRFLYEQVSVLMTSVNCTGPLHGMSPDEAV